MAVEIVNEAPSADSFTPLSEHQSQTPNTFFGGQPVLYFHSSNARLIVSKSQFEENSILHELHSSEDADGTSSSSEDEILISNVDIWVTSRNLVLYSTLKSKGFSITYPAIALHALGTHQSSLLPDPSSQVVLLQVNLHDTDLINSDDDIQTLDLTLAPATISEPDLEEAPNQVKALYDALSTCADLHPDPASPGSEENELEPGAGGWITSENMADFMDEDGNFVGMTVMGDPLGAGAGTVRQREEDDDENGVNGTGDADDGKWQRTG